MHCCGQFSHHSETILDAYNIKEERFNLAHSSESSVCGWTHGRYTTVEEPGGTKLLVHGRWEQKGEQIQRERGKGPYTDGMVMPGFPNLTAHPEGSSTDPLGWLSSR